MSSQLVGADGGHLDADGKVDLERSKAAAPDVVRERREDERRGAVRAREVVADLRSCRTAARAELAIEGVPVRVAADQDRAPADITAASRRKSSASRHSS